MRLLCHSALLLALGCGDPPTEPGAPDKGDDTAAVPTGCFAAAPAIDVGPGAAGFEPLSDGDPLVMVHGPQGGWHMLGSVRTHNMKPIVKIHFNVSVLETGVEVADNDLYVQTLPDGDDPCAGVYPGMYAYLRVDDLAVGDADTPPELLAYESLLFKATVTDDTDPEPDPARVVTAEVRVTATPDPVDLEDDGNTASPGR